MELSNGESALRTLKHRSKVPQAAVDLAASIATLLFGKQLALSSPLDAHVGNHNNDDDAGASAIDALPREQRRELLEQKLTTMFMYGRERWEPLAVATVVVRDVLAAHLHLSDASEAHIEKNFVGTLPSTTYVADDNDGASFAPFTTAFLHDVVAANAKLSIEHYEPRVRLATAKLLGVLAADDLAFVYATFVPLLTESIVCSMSRSPDFDDSGFDDVDDNVSVNGMETPVQSPASTPKTPSTPYRLDDVSGWRALESSLCALKFIVKGSGAAFLATTSPGASSGASASFTYLTSELCALLTTKSVFHINRHVRVVGLDAIAELCVAAPSGLFTTPLGAALATTLCSCLVRGLQDNWSQVRYAASIATRAFLLALGVEATATDNGTTQSSRAAPFLPLLVPRVCLNRYYVAERVAKHSQETWRLLFGTHGRAIVALYMQEIVAYYVDMTTHSVREAACQCIGELAAKVDAAAVQPFARPLVEALVASLYDSSWQVRDAAMLAASQFVVAFPADCEAFIEELFSVWLDHLGDAVWSVREDAAIALANAVRAYGDDALARILPALDDKLALAKTQPAMSQHELDAKTHAAAANHNHKAVDCCAFDFKTHERHDHHVNEPWASTDGAVYLVRELCRVAPDAAIERLPQVADVAILRHFPQTSVLQETVWKQVPLMCEALGKRAFKRHVELFFDPLVFTLDGSSRLAKFAARDCVASLATQIGARIFVGRLEANATWHDALAPLVASPAF